MRGIRAFFDYDKAVAKPNRTNQNVLDELGLPLEEFELIASIFQDVDVNKLLLLIRFGYFLAQQKSQTINESPIDSSNTASERPIFGAEALNGP